MRNLIVLVLFAASFVADIYLDVREGIPMAHIWHEIALFLVAMIAIGWQVYVIFQKNLSISHLNGELLETKKTYQDWKLKTQSNAQEIRLMIDQQFGLWHLSSSEKDVALLLIKGFSMKEIAVPQHT